MNIPSEDPDDLQPDGIASQPLGESVPRVGGILPKIVQFDELPRCGDEVWIASDGKLYRLRRTRQGKLILTK